jgi:N-acetylglucosamine-6-sulfatase
MRRLTTTILALACLMAPVPAWGAAVDKPNVVVIETDDQTVSDLASLPQTRRLIGGHGVYFRNSVVSESQCCPSRATFLTGKYSHNHRVLDTTPPWGGFQAFRATQTLPLWLQRAGYATVLVGKYFNGYGLSNPNYVPPGWTEWHGLWGPTIYRYFGFALNNNGVLQKYPGVYETNMLTSVAEDVIRRRAAARKPLFLWLTYVAPHYGFPREFITPFMIGSASPNPLFSGLFPLMKLPQSPALNEADVSDKPLGIRRRPRINGHEFAAIRYEWRRRQQSLVSVDYGVVGVIDALRATHQLDNTLLIFTSDNGFMSGQHRVRQGKVLPYEPSIRVPLMMRGPGVPRRRTSSQLVWNGDLPPTIIAAAGARAQGELDGQSLWPFIHDPGLRVSREVVLEGPPLGRKSPLPRFTGLRTERYVYVQHITGARELYDLRTDPYELTNLADVPAAQALVHRLDRRLLLLRHCEGVGCHTLPRRVR